MRRAHAPLLAVAAGVLVLRYWTPSDDAGAGLCLIRRCTGVACPGCGMTRAAGHLVKGEWTSALADHPLVVLAVLQVVVAAVGWWLVGTERWRPESWWIVNAVLVLDVLALLGVWAARAAGGTLPV